MSLPLSNIRVLDFTHLLPGELCSTLLVDLGCDITRVEPLKPGLGQKIPPVVKGESLYYWSLHRNKRRIALDLKNEDAIRLINQMIGQFDVVLENFRPGVMKRLGLDYDSLAAKNERLIYCSVSGYGQTSSLSQQPGHDLNLIAESGVLSQNVNAEGQPIVPGILIADYMSAMYAALGVVSALHERQTTGKGRHVDISMFNCALSTMGIAATALLYTGEEPPEGRPGSREAWANYNVYECKDKRYMAVAALEKPFWEIMCDKLQRPDLKARHPIGANSELKEELVRIFKTKTQYEWIGIFEGSDCCVSPVHNLDEALSFVPTIETGMISKVPHQILDQVPQLRSPLPFRNGCTTAFTVHDPASCTVEVLSDIGVSKAEIESLIERKVILSPST